MDDLGSFPIFIPRIFVIMSLISINQDGRIAEVILNRPEKRNALSPELVKQLTHAFEELNNSDSVKVIVLKSADKPFCAGADLGYLKEMAQFTDEENLADSRRLKDLFELIYNSPKITISLVEGPALAGGCGLATLVDFCFATSDATFGYTEARIGFVAALVMVYLRDKLPFLKMTEWLLTANVFSADKALEDGMVFKIVNSDNIHQEVAEFAGKLSNGVSSDSIKLTKSMMRNLPFQREQALEFAAQQNAIARKSNDCQKGISAFLNKEKLTW
jgi:methylglutaconyl-CoA hydratase